MRILGYAFFAVVFLAAVYVIPYLSRRRVALAHSPLDDRYAERLRLLRVADPSAGISDGGETGSLLFRRPEVIMDENVEREASGIGDLVRQRSRRKARISQRAAHRQRGWLGLGVIAALAVILLLLAGGGKLPWAAAIIVVVLAAVAGGFWAYLLTQMKDADIADRNAIAEYNADLVAVRGGTSGTRRPAVRRPGTGAAAIAEHEDSSFASGSESATRDESGADLLDRAASAHVDDESAATGDDAAASESVPASDEVPAEDASPKAEARERSRGGEASAGVERVLPTSKRSREERMVRRSISPYTPPTYESAPVPYRPKRLGESLAEPERRAGEKPAGLADRDVLDEALRRRRA